MSQTPPEPPPLGEGIHSESRTRALIESYRSEAARADSDRASRLLYEVARLYEDVLGDRRSAVEAVQEALALDGNSPTLLQLALRLSRADGKLQQTAALLERGAAATQDLGTRVGLLLDLADLQELRLGDEAQATETYERIRAEDPVNFPAVEALLRFQIGKGRWDQVAKLCGQLADVEEDTEIQTSLLLTAALLTQNRSERIRLLERCLAGGHDPVADLVLALLVTLPEDREEWREISRQLSEQAKLQPTATLHHQISTILSDHLAQSTQAIEHARLAIEQRPEELALWDRLADLLRREARWDELVALLRSKVSLLTDEASGRMELHLTLAEILDVRLGRTEEAIAALGQAHAIDPAHAHILQLMCWYHTKLKQWAALVDLQLDQAEQSEATESAAAFYRAAVVLHRNLDRIGPAIEALEHAVNADEMFEPAIWLLERFYRQDERHGPLVDLLYLQKQQTQSPARRLSLLSQIAAIQEHQLQALQHAIGTYREIRELELDILPVDEAIVRLCEQLDDPTTLLATLHELEERAPSPQEHATVLMRMACVIDEQLGDRAAALAHYRRAQELHPRAPGLAQAVAHLLVACDRWPELVQLHRDLLANAKHPEDRQRRLYHIGWLCEHHLGQRAQAADAYRESLHLTDDPSKAALRGLLRVFEPEDPEDIAQLAPLLKGLAGSRLTAAAMLCTALRLEEKAGARGDIQAARRLFWDASQLDPSSELSRFFLIRSLIARSDWARVVELLPPFWGALVALAGMRQPERALQLMREQVKLTPDSLAASRWSNVLATAQRRRTLEVESLTHRTKNEHDPRRRAAVRHRLAALSEFQPTEGATQDPVELHQATLEDLPNDERSLLALERLARERGDPALLARALEGQTPQLAAEERAQLLADRASLMLRLGRSEQALSLWRESLESDPGCRAAYDALKSQYLERGDSKSLRWLLEQGLDSVGHPRALSGDLLRRATFREERGFLDGALADLDQVLAINPGHAEALDRAVALLRSEGDQKGLAARLELAAKHTTSSQRQAAILLQLGQIYRDRFGDPVRAQDTLTRAVSADPNNVEALVQAAELQLGLDQPTEALSLLSRAVLRSEDPDQVCRAQLKIAHICGDILADPVRARVAVEAVLEVDPDHRDALELLVRLNDGQRTESAAVEQHLEKLAEVTTDPGEKAQLLVRLSEQLRRRLGSENPEALAPLEQAVELRPGNVDWLRLLVTAYESGQRWKELDALLDRHLESLDESDQAPFQLALGRTLGRRGRLAEARAVLHGVLHDDPSNQVALELLLDQIDSDTVRDRSLLDEAITLHRRLLQRNPLTVDAIRAIRKLCGQAERHDESFCAVSCLVLLEEASEEEAYFHQQQRERAPSRPTGTLPADQVQTLALPRGGHPVLRVLTLLRPHLAALFPPTLSYFGLDALESARLPANHPAWDVATICSGVLKLGHFEMIEARGGAPHGACLPGSPPVLVLPQSFLQLPMPEQLFLCGRLLARVAVATEALDTGRRDPLRVREIELVLVALQRSRHPEFGKEHAPAAILDDLVRRMRIILSSAELERGQQLASEAWGKRQALAPWAHSTEVGACSTGLLCCGGVDALSPFWFSPEGPISDYLLRELLMFSLSEQYTELRQTLHLQLT